MSSWERHIAANVPALLPTVGSYDRVMVMGDASTAVGVQRPGLVLFDVFGTLVEYQPDRSQLGYPVAHRLAQQIGFVGEHDRFVTLWDEASRELEVGSAATFEEFSMTDAAGAFTRRAGLDVDEATCEHLGKVFVGEWQQHVVPIAGVAEMLRRLAASMRVGVVSNTHDPDMVPALLGQMGVADVVSPVVLSVVHGRCKPHPSIYLHALAEAGCEPHDTLFVGDSVVPDHTAPRRLGMRALLIGRHPDVPDEESVTHVLDVESIAHAGSRAS